MGAVGMSGSGLGHCLRLHGEGRQELRQGGVLHRSIPLRSPPHPLLQRQVIYTTGNYKEATQNV